MHEVATGIRNIASANETAAGVGGGSGILSIKSCKTTCRTEQSSMVLDNLTYKALKLDCELPGCQREHRGKLE